MTDKKHDIEKITNELRTRWAEHPELLAVLHRNADPLTGRKPLGTTILLHNASELCQIDFPMRFDGAKPFIIDYGPKMNFGDLELVTRAEMESLVLKVLKARTEAGDHRFLIDSMGQLVDPSLLSGDPVGIPKCEEDPSPVKKGFKLKPNATGMYRQFVDRNHKR